MKPDQERLSGEDEERANLICRMLLKGRGAQHIQAVDAVRRGVEAERDRDSLARQLTEAERESGWQRDALQEIIAIHEGWSGDDLDYGARGDMTKQIAREALNPGGSEGALRPFHEHLDDEDLASMAEDRVAGGSEEGGEK